MDAVGAVVTWVCAGGGGRAAEPFDLRHADLAELELGYQEHRRAMAWMILRLTVGLTASHTLLAFAVSAGFDQSDNLFFPLLLSLGWLLLEISFHFLRQSKIARLQRPVAT